MNLEKSKYLFKRNIKMLITNQNIDFKQVNKNLKKELLKLGFDISNQSCLNLTSRALGYENYNTCKVAIEKNIANKVSALTLGGYAYTKLIFIKQVMYNAIQDKNDKSIYVITKDSICMDYPYLGDWGLGENSSIKEISEKLYEEFTEYNLSYMPDEKEYKEFSILEEFDFV
jgi:hypothetical protein